MNFDKFDITNLTISSDAKQVLLSWVLDQLARKIKSHPAIFREPREFSFQLAGNYVALLSWGAECDTVVVHEVYEIDLEAPYRAVSLFAEVAAEYNGLRVNQYRSPEAGHRPHYYRSLSIARDSMHDMLERCVCHERNIDAFQTYIPQSYLSRVPYATSALTLADHGIAREQDKPNPDFGGPIVRLEEALSCLHDIMIALSKEVLTPLRP